MVKPTGVVHEALEGGDHPCVALCDARIQGGLKGEGPEVFWGEGAGHGIEGNIELFRGAWGRQAVPGFAWLVGERMSWAEVRVCPGFFRRSRRFASSLH